MAKSERCGAMEVVGAIGLAMVSGVALVGRHERMSVLIIIQLGGLKDQMRCT